MSGYETNPIFFNKKKQRLDVQNTRYPPFPHHPTSDKITFLPYPPSHLQSGRHMCITKGASHCYFYKAVYKSYFANVLPINSIDT